MHRTRAVSVIAAAGLAACVGPSALAQDSVSVSSGLPGDAVEPHRVSPSEQVNDFVLDLAVKASSWGGKFAFGPAMKAGRSTTNGYFDMLIGAQAASARFTPSRPLLRPSYPLWNAAGEGVNFLNNNAPSSSANTAGVWGYQFGVAFMEFGPGPDAVFANTEDENEVVAGMIDFTIRNPNRLLVSRIGAAANKATSASAATASLGLGAIDELGNVHLLGDGYGLDSAARLANRYYIRVSALNRDVTRVNFLQDPSGAGANDAAATSFVRSSTAALTPPGIISAGLPGGAARPVMLGGDFSSNYIFENGANTTTTTKAYLPGAAGSSRGAVSFIPYVFNFVASGGSNAGTCAVLARTDSNTRTRAIQLFGVNTDGSVDSQDQIVLPTTSGQIVDPVDGFNPATYFGALSGHEFTNYGGQASFRGGNGQVAMTVLPGGELLAAALVAATGGGSGGGAQPQGMDDYIAVALVNPSTGAATWTIAAHSGGPTGAAGGLSKAIRGDYGADGVPGTSDAGEGDGVLDATPIGRIARASEVFAGAATGPSISSPAMDRRGSLYFLATLALNAAGGSTEYATGLLRANRNTATNGYELELLLKTGDVLPGPHSTRNYQVQYLGVADADSADSGAVWSGCIVQDAIPGAKPAAAAYGNPSSLGALVVRARIVYDFNSDGVYADPSAVSGSTSPDQAYTVAMAVMPWCRTGDFNRDGAKTIPDVFDMLGAWFTGQADWDGSGIHTIADVFLYIADWFAP